MAPGGDVLDGRVFAENRESVNQRLRAKGIVPLKIELLASGADSPSLLQSLRRQRKITVKDQMLFTELT